MRRRKPHAAALSLKGGVELDTVQLRFVGRTLASGEVCLGVRGDSEVRKLAFVLPDVAAGQLAYLNVEFSTPTKIPLQRADDGAWVCVLQAPALLESGIFGAQVEIFDGETVVWNSDIFHAVVRDSLSVNEDIEPVMLPELLEAEAALQAAIAKTDDILDAIDQEEARETAEAARVAAEQGRVSAEQGRVTAEQGRVTAESARISAEAGRVSAEQSREAAEDAREAAFARFEANIESGEYNGATFTPNVSAGGMLSWTNDKGLTNPQSVNIKGADGEDGLSVELRLSGEYLQWRPTGGVWQNLIALSEITGPAGADGTDGSDGTDGVDGQSPTITIGTVTQGATASATLTGTYPNYILNLTIPQGEQGESGVYVGTQEPTDSDVKVWINPDGESSPIPGLPVPGEDDVGKALVVGEDGVYELGEAAGAVDTDTTLSASGSPADAKATGDAIAGLADELNSLERTIELYYQMRRTGKVYQTKLWKFASNPTSTGEKLRDNAGLVFEPSTDTEEGQDDYLSGAHPMFEWVNVNYVRDEDGAPRPTAIEGMESYATTGAVDVGVMQMSFWWKWDDSPEDHVLVTVSDTPHPELGLQPWPECVKADDTVLPWCIGSKYFSGTASDGLLRSQPRLLPELWQSYNGMITGYQIKGAGYWGAGAVRNTWQMLWIAIKGGTKSSQSLFAGCTNYSLQYQVAAATTAQTYVVLSEAQAQNLVVGSCVCVGTGPGEGQTSLDRNYDYMRDIVPLARIDRIDGANVYLDCNAYNVPEGAYLSSMPWGAGSTDLVFGKHDGSRISNTNGKFPYRVQGREYAIGSYCVASDTVAYLLDNNSREIYVAPRGVAHSPTWATIQSTYTLVGNIPAYNDGTATDYYVGDVDVSMALGAWYPSAEGTSSATGFADRYYAGGSATNTQREYLQGGHLWNGSDAGSACVALGLGLGGALWDCAACD